MTRSVCFELFLASVLVTGSVSAQFQPPLLASRALASDTTGVYTVLAPRRAISNDGRYALIESWGINLIAGLTDRNLTTDVFLLDRTSQTMQLISRRSNQPMVTASGQSFGADMTPDGRWIVFRSSAADVVPGVTDNNGTADVFLFDRDSGTSLLVSRSWNSATDAANNSSFGVDISDDGRFVLFESSATNIGTFDNNNSTDLFLYDRTSSAVTMVSNAAGFPSSAANGQASQGQLSADGAYVAYLSSATNITAGISDSNAAADAYLWTRASATSTLISRQSAAATSTGNGAVSSIRFSADGQFVAYSTAATNVLAGISDSNAGSDVYRWNRQTEATELSTVSAASATATANGASLVSDISQDGNWILIQSAATDLVSGQTDSNAAFDLFLRDQSSGNTQLVSRAADVATQTPDRTSTPVDMSADARFVLFYSQSAQIGAGVIDGNGVGSDVFLFDRLNQVTKLVSHKANEPLTTPTDSPGSFAGSVSDDGQYVGFYSTSAQLVANTVDFGGRNDAFLKDFQLGTLSLLSRVAQPVTSTPISGSEGLGLSDDGRWLLYGTFANNVIGTVDTGNGSDLFLFDRDSRTSKLVTRRNGSASETSNNTGSSALSASGRFIAYTSGSTQVMPSIVDNNNTFDIFLFDQIADSVQLVTHTAASMTTTANAVSTPKALSSDGRYLLLHSSATDLVAGITDSNSAQDVFLFDAQSGATTLVSKAAGVGQTANGASTAQAISADGRWVAFSSTATNLISGMTDNNGASDVFLFDANTGTISLVSKAASGNQTSFGASAFGAMDASGDLIAFEASGTDLVVGVTDANVQNDVYLYRHQNQSLTLVSHADGAALSTGNGQSRLPFVSADGRFVGYSSTSSNLAAGITDSNATFDAILFAVATGDNRLISVSQSNPLASANNASSVSTLSPDGQFIGVRSNATNIAQDFDLNSAGDAFVFHQPSGTIKLMSRRADGNGRRPPFDSGGTVLRISNEGRSILMASASAELVSDSNDGNGSDDIFLIRDASWLHVDGFE